MEQYIAGPYCTLLLADAGAEVIKIERPGVGDPRRSMPPFAEQGGRKKAAGFMGYNRNKKSLALDVGKPEGKDIFRKLAAASDVLVENIRPGSMERQGLGYKDLSVLNPRLVYASISGFGRMQGRTGPYSDRPAFDIVAEAMSGIMHQVGFEDKPPSWTLYGMADVYSGMVTAFSILQALLMRGRTGRGQYVDTAMYDTMLSLNETMVTLFSVAGISPHRGRPSNIYPRSAYRAKDGYVALNIPDERQWARLCETMKRPDLIEDERSCGGPARARNRGFVDPIIEGWFAGLTRQEAVDTLNAAGVPCGPVNTAEDVFACPQVEARRMLMTVDDPEVGPYRFSRTPGLLSAAPDLPADPAPALGQHTRAILEGELGYAAPDVESLAKQGIIGL
jgi:formyl-CoA transferase